MLPAGSSEEPKISIGEDGRASITNGRITASTHADRSPWDAFLRPRVDDSRAHQRGSPIIRPLFYDFPADREAWGIDNSYMFGPDVLVAPILFEGQRIRECLSFCGNTLDQPWQRTDA